MTANLLYFGRQKAIIKLSWTVECYVYFLVVWMFNLLDDLLYLFNIVYMNKLSDVFRIQKRADFEKFKKLNDNFGSIWNEIVIKFSHKVLFTAWSRVRLRKEN